MSPCRVPAWSEERGESPAAKADWARTSKTEVSAMRTNLSATRLMIILSKRR